MVALYCSPCIGSSAHIFADGKRREDPLKDYYSILGVPPSAAPTEIRRAFRKLALEHHPDVNKSPGAEDRFREINTAYQVLMDADKRAGYDAARRGQVSWPSESGRQSAPRASGPSQPKDSPRSARRQYFRRRVRLATDRRATWNYYDVLGVPHNATEEKIIQAYQSLYRGFYAGRTHDPGTADILREIIEAREVLTDPSRRLAYDSLPPDQQPPGRPKPPPPVSRLRVGCFPAILAIPLLLLLTLARRAFNV